MEMGGNLGDRCIYDFGGGNGFRVCTYSQTHRMYTLNMYSFLYSNHNSIKCFMN
jgi:hypothetical protein